ncbi:hypothetical protein [Salicibibacter kimchii]|uniref:hypothetical protein n=1 Tax=Salicibibacter kimchii TaxID=2099786 RepID=UPI003AB0E1F9
MEVQDYKDDDIAERMFQYFYRIFDKYQQKIHTIALLADPDRFFQTNSLQLSFSRHGINLCLQYV